MPSIGDVLAKKYRLVRLLGKGGMGAVYEARHERIGKRVAVKLVLAKYAENEEMVVRFTREAEAAAAIGHPAIIDIHDIGTAEDGALFLVMEYLEGESLRQRIEREGQLDPHFTAYVVCQVLSALAAAHEAGIVHRDLKPDNVFLADTGQRLPSVKLLDFGISKITKDPKAKGMTRSGVIMGSPYYIPPEQAQGSRDVDHRADLYAMGVIIYEALTGARPFEADNLMALLYHILSATPTAPTALRPDLPDGLDQVISRAMERDRDARYQSALEMLEALLPFVDEHGRERLALGKVPGHGSQEAPGTEQDVWGSGIGTDMAWHSKVALPEEAKKPSGRLRTAGLLVGLAALALGAFATVWVVTTRPKDAPGVTASVDGSAPSFEVTAPSLLSEDGGVSVGSSIEVDAISVALTFEVEPSGAAIFVDGEPAAGSRIERPRSERSHLVRIELEGFQPWEREVRFERDTTILVALLPQPESLRHTPSAMPPQRRDRERPAEESPEPPEPAAAPPQPAPQDRFRTVFE